MPEGILMVQKIKIQCPHCFEECELFLSTNAMVIVMNCPSCWTPLAAGKSGAMAISEDDMAQLAVDNRQKTMSRLLEKLNSVTGAPKREHAKVLHSEASHKGHMGSDSDTNPSLTTDGCGITCDDITNLRIELATCEDSLDFILRI